MGPDGEVFKAFNAHDAQGIRKLKKIGIESIILTGRISKIVENRAKEMDITKVYQDVQDKKEKVLEIAKKKKIKLQDIAYIGDDENDYEAICMRKLDDNLFCWLYFYSCDPEKTPEYYESLFEELK